MKKTNRDYIEHPEEQQPIVDYGLYKESKQSALKIEVRSPEEVQIEDALYASKKSKLHQELNEKIKKRMGIPNRHNSF